MTREEFVRKDSWILAVIRDRCELTRAEKDYLNILIEALEQEPKYCDRNICLKNEYNGIGCDECEVTKSQEPSGDLIQRQALLKLMGEEPFNWTDSDKELQEVEDYRNFRNMVEQLPSVNPQPTGHCEDCKHFRKLPYHADTLGKCFHHGGFCPKGNWYCADFEPQEGE